MKRIALLLLAAAMILTLAVSASAFFEAEEAFCEVAFTIGKQTTAWNPDGTITDGEYFKVDIQPTWLSYAINDNDTDAGLAYAKATTPELYMSWDENYVYTATRYTVSEGHECLWDSDPASMWYSGAVQFNYANFDEVASEYRLEYGVGLSSDTGDTLYTVWADGCGEGYEPNPDDAKVWLDGNTLTYETRCPWSAFADEDNTGYKEGNGFNTTFVWSIGKGQDYVHIQLAEGCTGNGKHAEYMAQVTLAATAPSASGAAAAAEPTEPTTIAHWRFQNDAKYVSGSVDDDNITVHDLTNNGNDLVVATVGNGDQLDIFTWDDGCEIPSAKGDTALKFDNTKKQAATVDPYSADETSYTGGYTSGKYLETVENAPMNSMTFENGFSFEIVYKLSPELDNNYNRYTGLFSRQGVVESANEPPFSIALAEWDNDDSGTLGVNGTWMQYVHVDPDGAKTNREYGNAMMYGGDWHHILVTSDGDLTDIYIDGEYVDTPPEFAAIAVTDPTYSWEVGVGRKLGEGHEGDSKNVNSPEGMIRRLFAGDISEIRVTNHYMDPEQSLFFVAADVNYPEGGTLTGGGAAPAAETPAAEAGGTELLAKSWDTIFVDYEMMVDGSANVWLADNPVEGPIEQLEVRGWTHISTPITAYAYTIDGGDAVKSDEFIQDRPDVKAAINEIAEGFDISIDVSGLAVGDHVIKIYAVDENGGLVDSTFEFPFTKEAAPSKGLATVEDAAKGKNIIKNYEFVDGTNGFGGEGPENLWDGETSTKFCTNEFPAESIAKLDGVYKITGFTMATANDNADYNGRSPNAWTISVSADGENWTELKKGDDSFFEELNFTYFAGDGKAEGVSYVKFAADGTASGTFQVSEVTLFGDKTGDAPAAEEPAAEEPAAEEPAAEEPKAEEPKTETPAADNKPAETAKSGCGSMIGGGLIVLVTILGSAWISKRH
jgi:hypothetical protein